MPHIGTKSRLKFHPESKSIRENAICSPIIQFSGHAESEFNNIYLYMRRLVVNKLITNKRDSRVRFNY